VITLEVGVNNHEEEAGPQETVPTGNQEGNQITPGHDHHGSR
jgi:hypothetical protein